MHVDINCDMGESFGAYDIGADEQILPHVTSANIACGFHGGDPAVMRKTVAAAKSLGVAVGAHPGLPDLAGFGRRTMQVTPQEVYDMIIYQVGALLGVARAARVELQHVKPHGALYNMAAAQPPLADSIARAVRDVDDGLVLYGLAGSHLLAAAERAGIASASEAFADRNYLPGGALVPRQRPDALVTNAGEAVRRVLRMVREGVVADVDGNDISLRADTVCIHGDGPTAAEMAKQLRAGLAAAGVQVRAPGRRDAKTHSIRSR
jgi:5-oxoprolinase (ATP-hydrolysing) subunit A